MQLEKVIPNLNLIELLGNAPQKRPSQLDLLLTSRLRILCKEYELSPVGKRAVLIERLNEYSKEHTDVDFTVSMIDCLLNNNSLTGYNVIGNIFES